MATTEFLVILGLFICLALYGFWKHSTAETNTFNRFVEQAATLELKSKSHQRDLDSVMTRIDALEKRAAVTDQDLEACQDHMARLRRSQKRLHEKMIPRKIEFNLRPSGAIPIEIHTGTPRTKKPESTTTQETSLKIPIAPPKNLLKKIGVQLDNLSQ